uniref:Uncharacterized protein n=1 Tax=Micrurus lemniscatus lemniscatus TaxID=129467 RepID=A0A2D4HZS2_MICLE
MGSTIHPWLSSRTKSLGPYGKPVRSSLISGRMTYLRVSIMTEKALFLDYVSFLQSHTAPPVFAPTENYCYLHYYHHHPFGLSSRGDHTKRSYHHSRHQWSY